MYVYKYLLVSTMNEKITEVQNPRHVILSMTIQITFWFRYYNNYNKHFNLIIISKLFWYITS